MYLNYLLAEIRKFNHIQSGPPKFENSINPKHDMAISKIPTMDPRTPKKIDHFQIAELGPLEDFFETGIA